MLEGHCQNAPRPRGRVRRWFASQHGHVVLDAGVALGLIVIVLGQSWARHSPVTRWRVSHAAHLLESDLRLTQQAAVSTSGNGVRAELCLRSDGYDVYTVRHRGSAGQSTDASGTRIKHVTAGKEYPRGIEITADARATYQCTADATRRAFVYLASGAPMFPDSISHRVEVELRGQALHVTIQPGTGTTSVSP